MIQWFITKFLVASMMNVYPMFGSTSLTLISSFRYDLQSFGFPIRRMNVLTIVHIIVNCEKSLPRRRNLSWTLSSVSPLPPIYLWEATSVDYSNTYWPGLSLRIIRSVRSLPTFRLTWMTSMLLRPGSYHHRSNTPSKILYCRLLGTVLYRIIPCYVLTWSAQS